MRNLGLLNILSVALFLFAEASSAQNVIPLKENQTISTARAALLRAGWQPVETFQKDLDGNLLHSDGGTDGMYELGFIELEYCSGTGFNYCFFNYKKDGQCLRVQTEGEWSPQYRNEPKVIGWVHECPPVFELKR